MNFLALALMGAGVLFLIAAAVGVLRFPDPLQRMHASTKAGTIGAVLVVLGSAVAPGRGGALSIGTVTVVFLLMTVPVAGHLLGRAIYVSGARLTGLDDKDALEGKLARRELPLEERTSFEPSRAAEAVIAPTERPEQPDRQRDEE